MNTITRFQLIASCIVIAIASILAAESQPQQDTSEEAQLKLKYLKSGFEYIDLKMNTNFTTAVGKCDEAGFHLGEIQTSVQEQVLLRHATTYGAHWFWVDGSDFVQEGTWRSLRTAKELKYFHWFGSNPSGGVKENCLMWMHNMFYTGFGDTKCTTDINHILCETSA